MLGDRGRAPGRVKYVRNASEYKVNLRGRPSGDGSTCPGDKVSKVDIKCTARGEIFFVCTVLLPAEDVVTVSKQELMTGVVCRVLS